MPRPLYIAFVLTIVLSAAAQTARPHKRATLAAPTPPMGWNSWDSYGLTITEPQFRDNVDVLARTLKPFGWTYAVIDEGWFLKNPEDRPTPGKLAYELDANGRYIPVPARFPSAVEGNANTGFKVLGAYVHGRGLKFGIHIVRGIPRESVMRNLAVAGSRFRAQDVADQADACPWDPTNWGVRETPAGQAWYDSLLAQYAGWGVDFLKVDCISDHPYKPGEVRMIRRAIQKTGRPIVLSLSPGPTSPGIAREVAANAELWRISDDVWDYWTSERYFPRSVHDQFELIAGWAPYARPGSWPDADMLAIGYLGPNPGDGKARDSRLTHNEQQSMLTLWAIARSPLILGANLTRLDDWTTRLLTNQDILDVNQHAHDARQVVRSNNTVVWTSHGKPGVTYLAFFNLNDKPTRIHHGFDFYNLPATSYTMQELWSHSDLKPAFEVDIEVPAHGTLLFRLTPP